MSHLRHLTLMLVLIFLGSACASDPQPDFPQEGKLTVEAIEEATIEPETLQVFFDDEDMLESTTESSSSLTVRTQALVGEPSRLVPALRDGLRTANDMLRPGIELLNEIIEAAPVVEHSDRHIRYEFQSEDGALISLVVARDADHVGRQYNYVLTVRAPGTERSLARPLLGGFFRPGPRDDAGRQTGEGVLRYDYTAISGFDPDGASGVGAVGFRVGALRKQLTVLFVSFKPGGSEDVVNARYNYDLGRNGGGVFTFRLLTDIFKDSPGNEVLRQAAIWTPDKAGRGHAVITGEGFPGEITVQECWGTGQEQVWSSWDPLPADQVNDGDEQNCPEPFIGLELPLPDDEPIESEDNPSIPEE